jgi:hypothetical protein
VAVAEDDVRTALARDLEMRIGGDWRIVAEGTAPTAIRELERLAAASEDVATVIAGVSLPEGTGIDFLAGDAVARDRQGFLLTGRDVPAAAWPLARPPLHLETSVPGVFAAGDVRQRSVKRVASAVGEGAIAVQLVHDHLAEPPT